MKYIKMFNESERSTLSKVISDIRDFSIESLIELVDKGFIIEVLRRNKYTIELVIKKGSSSMSYFNKIFTWKSVKDKVIPLIEVLIDDYDIKDIYLYGSYSNIISYTLEQLIDDDFMNRELDKHSIEFLKRIELIINIPTLH